jgi:hypothetical protein
MVGEIRRRTEIRRDRQEVRRSGDPVSPDLLISC